MKSLEPRQVEIGQVLSWYSEAFKLLKRRVSAFLTLEFIFILFVFFAAEASASIAEFTPSVLLLSVFFIFVAFVLYFFIADAVVMSFSADNSHPVRVTDHIYTLLQSQGTLLKMAVLALFIGSFYWVVPLTISPEKSVLQASEAVIGMLLDESSFPIMFELNVTATFLYFTLLATFILRIFFSIPLALFHELNYKEAQALSHKALFINIVPMSVVLMSWVIVLLFSMKLMPLLALFFLPLFASFTYVAYRSIFLGVDENAAVKVMQTEGAHAIIV